MNYYQALITLAVKRFLADEGKTADWLARRMGLARSTVHAKMALSSPRAWSLDDVLRLGDLGVRVPRIPVRALHAKDGANVRYRN